MGSELTRPFVWPLTINQPSLSETKSHIILFCLPHLRDPAAVVIHNQDNIVPMRRIPGDVSHFPLQLSQTHHL